MLRKYQTLEEYIVVFLALYRFTYHFSNNHFRNLGNDFLNFGSNSSYLMKSLFTFASRSMMIEIKKNVIK